MQRGRRSNRIYHLAKVKADHGQALEAWTEGNETIHEPEQKQQHSGGTVEYDEERKNGHGYVRWDQDHWSGPGSQLIQIFELKIFPKYYSCIHSHINQQLNT